MTNYVKLVGVYHADGSIWGEIKYAVGKFVGTSSCALCVLTHNQIGEKAEWKDCRTNLGIPFETLHLDERPKELRNLTDGLTPCIVGQSVESYSIVISSEQLEACKGDIKALEMLLREVLA